jgi:hypothetical protein
MTEISVITFQWTEPQKIYSYCESSFLAKAPKLYRAAVWVLLVRLDRNRHDVLRQLGKWCATQEPREDSDQQDCPRSSEPRARYVLPAGFVARHKG